MVNRRRFLSGAALGGAATGFVAATAFPTPSIAQNVKRLRMQTTWPRNFPGLGTGANFLRSEEHTSELQSQGGIPYAVFCLKKQHHRRHQPKRFSSNPMSIA